jgi:hypothetical protein
MTTTQDVEQRQIPSNLCVNGHQPGNFFVLTNHSPGPAASQNPGTGYVDPFFDTTLAEELPLISTQITQSQGSPSELRVGVTGVYLDPDDDPPISI